MLRTLPAALTLATLTGCFWYVPPDPGPPPPGDISFDWEFEGEPDCTLAGVREIDVVVTDAFGDVYLQVTEPCVGGGLTLLDFDEGSYVVLLDAYGPRDERLYTGDFEIDVVGGRDNYAGVVSLFAVDAAPPPPPVREDGALSMYWGFAYPTPDAYVTACDHAGVVDVDVFVDPLFDAPSFAGTFDCRDQGVVVDGLIAGPYVLRLVSYGRYAGDDVALYDSGDVDLWIEAGAVADLGDVALDRVDESFADLDLAWSSPYGSCDQLGIGEVEIEIERVGGDEIDDAFVADCRLLGTLRATFVPGTYVVTAFAYGYDADWLATSTVDVPPGYVAPVFLDLVPID